MYSVDKSLHCCAYFLQVGAFYVGVLYFNFFVFVFAEEITYGGIAIWCFICLSIFCKSSFHICFTIMETSLYLLFRDVLYPIIQEPIIPSKLHNMIGRDKIIYLPCYRFFDLRTSFVINCLVLCFILRFCLVVFILFSCLLSSYMLVMEKWCLRLLVKILMQSL